ncbi:DNA -binding domain-containing protein [Bradyrhizobium sp. vgs-9]|uniref:DNA -binding domain-containing protein n=1 Tax=Bradyrhizobium TaxID=374 RepID=UPI00201378A4|nr:DUF2285 domain-containing protein [Bradyrhizobium japonicum]
MYRVITAALFGKKRTHDRAWQTHEVPNRTSALVQGGLAWIHGCYRKLLRPVARTSSAVP